MAFMMSPILGLSVAGLEGKDMAQAVGLSNMIRQLGGSVGIAVINLYLTATNAKIRGSMLGYINSDGVSGERFQLLIQNYLSKGYSQVEAEAIANRMMDNTLTRQQMIVSYDHGFLMVASILLICIPVVLLIRTPKGKTAAVSDH